VDRFPKDANTIFMGQANFYETFTIGSDFLCATQMFNHIPGQFNFVRKDAILDRLEYCLIL